MQEFLYRFVDLFFSIYTIMVFIYILSSWIPNLRESAFGETLGKLVEPVLAPFRRLIPPLGMIDISPIFALIALKLAQSGAIALLNMIFGA